MVNKKLGLGVLVIISAFLIIGSTIVVEAVNPTGDPTVSPTKVEVGDSVAVSGGNFSNWGTDKVNISIGGDIVIEENVLLDSNNESLKEDASLKIPEGTDAADSVELLIEDVSDANNNYTTTIKINNSKPTITADSQTVKVGKTDIGKIAISDKNGDDDLNSCSISDYGDFNSGDINVELTENDGTETAPDTSAKCKLTFASGKEPTSSDVGKHVIELSVTDGTDTTKSNITINVEDYLEVGEVDVDEDEYKPGDTVKITLNDIENNIGALGLDDEEISGIEITLEDDDGLDVKDEEISPDDFDLKDDGDKQDVTVEFMIPYDAEDKTYELEFSIEGKDNNDDSRVALAAASVDVDKESHDLVVTDLNLTESKASCGDVIELDFKVINIGSNDEENVEITVKNSALGIEETIDTIEDLKSGKDKSFSDEKIVIPDEAYDEDFKITVRAQSDDTSASEYKVLTLEDCDAEFFGIDTESLVMNPKDEKEVTISIENFGLDDEDYELEITGVDDFGTYNLSVEDEDNIEVKSGETEEITLTITANKDAELKDYDVEVKVLLDSEEVASRTVEVTVEESGGLLSGLAVFGGDGGSVGLTIGILLALAFIGYLAYQIWGKKPKDELKELEEKDEEKTGSIIFEGEDKKGSDKSGSKKGGKKGGKKKK